MSKPSGLKLLMALAVAGGVVANQPSAAAEKRKGVFQPQVATLKNGMMVVVITNRRAPVVRHMVWYRVGAADEPPGKSGIAHFLEHLMFKRTKILKAGEFDRIVHRNGGQQNAFTSQDYTAYFQTVAKDRLPIVMRLEADRMINLVIDVKEVAAERKVVEEERRSRTENRPNSLLWEAARATLWRNHPYGIPVIGWMHEIHKLNRKDALAFYRRYYRPNNAVLIVAGDVTMKEVLPLAKKYYGPIKAGPIPPRIRPQEPPSRTARRVTLHDKRVAQPRLGRMYLAPSLNNAQKKHAYALMVLNQILGSSAVSRLYESLVVKQKLATRAGSWYDGGSFDDGEFGLYANPRSGVSVAKVEQALDAEIAKLLTKGVTKEEVDRAKQSMLDSAIFARDNMYTGAMIFGRALTTGRTIKEVEAWPKRIGSVTVEAVNAAARYVLRSRRSVTAILLPAKKAALKKAAPKKAAAKKKEG
jgi:zinc protease